MIWFCLFCRSVSLSSFLDLLLLLIWRLKDLSFLSFLLIISSLLVPLVAFSLLRVVAKKYSFRHLLALTMILLFHFVFAAVVRLLLVPFSSCCQQ